MIAGLRFRLYRRLLAWSTARDFDKHEVWPLEIPADDHVDVEPLAPEFPRLFGARNFPTTEHAPGRHRGARFRGLLLPFVSKIPAGHTAAIPADLDGLLEEIYPERYRKIWPQPPSCSAGVRGRRRPRRAGRQQPVRHVSPECVEARR